MGAIYKNTFNKTMGAPYYYRGFLGASWKTLIEGSHVIYFVIARFSTATFTVFVFITVILILTITHVNVANHSRQKLDFESSLLVIT